MSLGSFGSIHDGSVHVRVIPDSDRTADMLGGPLRANRRHGATDGTIGDPGTHVPVERAFTASIDDMERVDGPFPANCLHRARFRRLNGVPLRPSNPARFVPKRLMEQLIGSRCGLLATSSKKRIQRTVRPDAALFAA
jgi:hypothetical protein